LRYTYFSLSDCGISMARLLRDIVPQILSHDEWQVVLARQWKEAVGNLKTRIRLEKIFDDTLVVGVYEYHWMQELYLLSPLLQDSLNKFLGHQRINHLRFVLVEDRKRVPRKPKPKLLVRPETVVLSIQQESALLTIEDEAFRKTLREYWGRCSALEDKESL